MFCKLYVASGKHTIYISFFDAFARLLQPGEPPGVAPFLSCLYSNLEYNFTVFSYF